MTPPGKTRASVEDAPTFGRPERSLDHVPGRVVVRFDREALAAAAALPTSSNVELRLQRLPQAVGEPLDYLRRNAGLRSVDPLFTTTPLHRRKPAERDRLAAIASVRGTETDVGSGLAVLDLSEKKITRSMLRRISGSSLIEVAEPLPARWLFAAHPDPMENLQWGLPAIRYFHASRSSAAPVCVGILDSGIDPGHPDLPKPVHYSRGGYGPDDPVGHGTHVAGVIAANTNNGVGIAGIADCGVAVWKVFPDNPADPYLDSVAYLKALGEVAAKGVSVVNLSLGGEAHSRVEADLFARAIDQGVTFVAAMGNEFQDGNPISYPAAYDDVISVGAVNETRARSHFSNTGDHIDLCAPGSNILSTLPTTSSPQRGEKDYAVWSGTSMATPHVAAAAALLKAKKPTWSPKQIAKRLKDTAVSVPEMNGAKFTKEHGNGLLDLRAALS